MVNTSSRVAFCFASTSVMYHYYMKIIFNKHGMVLAEPKIKTDGKKVLE